MIHAVNLAILMITWFLKAENFLKVLIYSYLYSFGRRKGAQRPEELGSRTPDKSVTEPGGESSLWILGQGIFQGSCPVLISQTAHFHWPCLGDHWCPQTDRSSLTPSSTCAAQSTWDLRGKRVWRGWRHGGPSTMGSLGNQSSWGQRGQGRPSEL